MTTPQDSNKTTATVADKAAPTSQKVVSAKQETGGASSTKTATGTQKTVAQKSASTRAKSTLKTATTSARRSTAAKPVKQSSQGDSKKDTSVESKHIADQVQVFSSRRVWPD